MKYTKGEWKRYGQHIHLNESDTSSEIVTVLCPMWMPKEEAEANAHLISAAPELYEAVRGIYTHLPSTCRKLGDNCPKCRAMEALAKAEGTDVS